MNAEAKVGIDGSKKVLKLVAKAVVLGVEIAKDGVNVDDLKHAPAVIAIAQEIIDVIKADVSLGAEWKDLDAMEVVVLIQEAVSEFQAAKDAIGNKSDAQAQV